MKAFILGFALGICLVNYYSIAVIKGRLDKVESFQKAQCENTILLNLPKEKLCQ